MTPENSRTFNHPRPPSYRRIHLQVAPPASPLSTDITHSLLFSNDAPLISSDAPSLIDHAPGRPVPSSELPPLHGLDLLSEPNSSVGENSSRARCKGTHASSVPSVATEHEQKNMVRSHKECRDSFPDNDDSLASSAGRHPKF